jgi:hypothetical protein
MDDVFAKEYLHNDLRDVREVMLWKLEGLSEYDIRRPLTSTGTNLLGLVKHLSNTEARYFGDIFGRPFPERLPWWDDDAEFEADMWVTPGPRSWTGTGRSAPTPTPPSTLSTSTLPVTSRGGPGRT